jgi:diacylglycerol kinase (ATP)
MTQKLNRKPYPTAEDLQIAQTDAQALKGFTGVKRVVLATAYSLAGLKAAFQKEAAFRQLLLMALVLIPLAFTLDVVRVERALLVGVVVLALIIELLNSAIESTVDRISLELHPLSKQAKDMGSAAQLLTLGMIFLTWTIILV